MPLSKKRAPADDSDSETVVKKARTKGSKSSTEEAVVGGGAKNAEGEEYWKISEQRRLVVSEFKGKRMVSIREYYEKDGQMLPGKKGITMPLDQFAKVISLIPHIEEVLKEKGEMVPRPDYSGAEPMEKVEEQDAEDEDIKATVKKNFEETSEEE